MDALTSPQVWLVALSIFVLRVINMSLSTLRMLLMLRGKKAITWILGVCEAGVFVIALTYVVSDLNNWLNILAYATGFATGNSVGMWIENKLAVGYVHLRVISSHKGTEIIQKLRAEGYAVTEIEGHGRDGVVSIITASVLRRQVNKVRAFVEKVDPEAFMTGEDLQPIRRGFWRS